MFLWTHEDTKVAVSIERNKKTIIGYTLKRLVIPYGVKMWPLRKTNSFWKKNSNFFRLVNDEETRDWRVRKYNERLFLKQNIVDTIKSRRLQQAEYARWIQKSEPNFTHDYERESTKKNTTWETRFEIERYN